MNEKPLERLNYYNGMPLEAADFKTEQDYHIRTRRWLNKSLYSAGIARGLEVRPVPGQPRVMVSPGLALDSEGREIILLEDTLVEVCSYSGTSESTVEGNYLVIEYAETLQAHENGSCAVRTAGTNARTSASHWGGPSRIEAQVKLSWVPFVPQSGSNQIVLARVELAKGCKSVHQIDAGARRYVGAGSAATVRQYALEGEREVACLPGTPPNKATVYFHIRGRTPNAVTLFLKAASFSSLHYTEVGHHKHALDVGLVRSDGEHRHDLGEHHTDDSPVASQLALLEQPDTGEVAEILLKLLAPGAGALISHQRNVTGLKLAVTPLYHYSWTVNNPVGPDPVIKDGDYPPTTPGDSYKHEHPYGSVNGTIALTKDADANSRHTHQLQSTAQYAGIRSTQHPTTATDISYTARGGAPLTYFQNLLISIDGIDRTEAIKAQIVDSVATNKALWQAGLGNGASNHPIVEKQIDAVPIRLDFLPGVTFGEGQHTIEFSVESLPGGGANGGKVLYNLYVE